MHSPDELWNRALAQMKSTGNDFKQSREYYQADLLRPEYVGVRADPRKWLIKAHEVDDFAALHRAIPERSTNPDEWGMAYWLVRQRANEDSLNAYQDVFLTAIPFFLWDPRHGD